MEISIDGLLPKRFSVCWSSTAHHHLLTFPALRLSSASKDAPPALPAGSCNLYLYPKVTPDDPSAASTIVGEDAVAVLDKMVTALFTTTDLLDFTDQVGAFPDHALNVSNTAESLRVMQQVYALRPTVMQRAHVPGFTCGALFTHETSLHLFVVNKREQECIQSLKLATQRLSKSDVTELLRLQCSGLFFHNKPMCGYGGHVMAFAAGFGQVDVCSACVAMGHSEWKDWRCELTGYLPIHVATVRDQGEMVDWLVATFGIVQLSAEVAGFTPLLLATRLGHQSLVRRLLKHDHEILWTWGNLTQWRLRLQPSLDSHASKGFTTVIELLGRCDARTQEMTFPLWSPSLFGHLP